MSFALLLEPNEENCSRVGKLFQSKGVPWAAAKDGDQGWRALASGNPDVVFISQTTPKLEEFYRRLRDEYMGRRPRMVAIASESELSPSLSRLDFDAVLVTPLSPALLLSVLEGGAKTVSLDLGRVREMLKLTCLSGDLQESLDAVAQRLGLVYGVRNCVVLATASERQWVGSIGDPIPSTEWPALWLRCDQAVNAGAPLLAQIKQPHEAHGTARSAVETRFAVPINAPGGAIIGAICLFVGSPWLIAAEARDALSDLAVRLGAELSWRSVHERVSFERDRLRESAMLDPLLGIQSRAALEQALATEIGRYRRTNEPLTVAMLDVVGLHKINDRYGHLTGDQALKHVATTTRRMSRAQDIVGRFGGDEIAILLPSTSVEGAKSLMGRVRDAIEESAVESDGASELSLSISIGITPFDGAEDDPAALLVRAASSAEAAKRRGEWVGVANSEIPEEVTSPAAEAGEGAERFEAGVTLAGMYEINHEISRGAMGVVYRAEDLGLSRPVAIKMLRPDLVSNRTLVQKFRSEAAILASLHHDNLVQVYAFLQDKDDLFFVMELVEGVSLDNVIAEYIEHDSDIALERSVVIVNQVAGALDAMHDAGVMHRDVKPGNIVMDRTRDRAVLVDVGLAQRFGQKGEPAGTPGFIAPESFQRGAETPATDVYGLATTMYTLLVGRTPFGRSDDYREILRRQLSERPPLASSFRDDLTPEVDLVLMRGMATDPRERYAAAGEFARELKHAIRHGGEATLPSSRRIDLGLQGDDELGLSAARDGDSAPHRTLTLNMDLLPPASAHEPEPMTRGIIFRGAARVLGLRAANAWVRTIARSNTKLADALALQTSPMAWLPSSLFTDMLSAVAASGRNADTFARQLGATVVAQTFRRFYPSSPESLSPRSTLSAAEILWKKYHSWGLIDVKRLDEGRAQIRFEAPNGSPSIYAFVEGWLHQVVSMSGGGNPTITVSPSSDDQPACDIDIRWRG